MTSQELITKTLECPDFPKRHKETPCYVDSRGFVCQDFLNTDNKPMRRIFRFGVYNMDGKYVDISQKPQIRGGFEALIWSAEFTNPMDKLACLFEHGKGRVLIG